MFAFVAESLKLGGESYISMRFEDKKLYIYEISEALPIHTVSWFFVDEVF
jgi:hypothetical protein